MDFKVLGQLISSVNVVVVQSLSCVWLFVTSCTAAYRTGFPVLHCLLEFAQTHVHWVSDAIKPSPFFSCLQFFPASGSFPMSQLFASGSQILVLQLQHQSLQWIFRVDSLYNWHVWSPCTPRDSQESSPAPQFKSISWLLPILGEAWLGFLP